jgi:hypothetical protein
MSLRPKWQNFRNREWDRIKESWVAHVPRFQGIGSPPDPGLEQLVHLRSIALPDNHERFQDVPGLRTNALSEAVFLFHKCSHTSLAAQRIGESGMHSWSMFNAYHSAYLGAKGIMALLGVALPKINGNQVAIDLFPEPQAGRRSPMVRRALKQKQPRYVTSTEFNEFLIVRLAMLDQRYLWEAFQRMLTITRSTCWDMGLRQDLLALSYEAITPPRNSYLYKAHFWPLSDLTADASFADFDRLIGTYLDVATDGFLLRLCFSVYYLFDQLMRSLAEDSGVIKQQIDASRVSSCSGLAVLGSYATFEAQVSKSGANERNN